MALSGVFSARASLSSERARVRWPAPHRTQRGYPIVAIDGDEPGSAISTAPCLRTFDRDIGEGSRAPLAQYTSLDDGGARLVVRPAAAGGGVVPIVHQYDRCPELATEYNRTYLSRVLMSQGGARARRCTSAFRGDAAVLLVPRQQRPRAPD